MKTLPSKPIIIAGPCAAESRDQIIKTATAIKAINPNIIFRAGIWKPRTMPNAFEGIGAPGIPWLHEVKKDLGLEVCTEVANSKHTELCLNAGIRTLWIGARTTANPFFIEEICNVIKGEDVTIMVKNPIHPDLNSWIGCLERFKRIGVKKLIAIHRGFHPLPNSKYRNYPNWQIPVELKSRYPEMPIITDISHICGNRTNLRHVAQDAYDMNMDGLMIETHCDPDRALSDSFQQITPQGLKDLLDSVHIPSETLMKSESIDELRHTIDALDYEILELMQKRLQTSMKIGNIKKENDVAIFQPDRWKDVLEKRHAWARDLNIREYFVDELFKVIHSESINSQKHD